MFKKLINMINRLFKKRNQEDGIRRCKKCGAELAEKTKRNLCLNCKQKRIEKWKRDGAMIGMLAVTIVSADRFKKK